MDAWHEEEHATEKDFIAEAEKNDQNIAKEEIASLQHLLEEAHSQLEAREVELTEQHTSKLDNSIQTYTREIDSLKQSLARKDETLLHREKELEQQ